MIYNRPGLVMAALILMSLPVSAGDITGHLLDSYGVDCHHIYYGANIVGDNPAGVGFGTTTLGGLYRTTDLPAGIYSMGWQEKDGRGRVFRFGIKVPETGEAVEEYRYRQNTYVLGTHWMSPWPKEIRQSFKATGIGINQIALRTAGGLLRISVHKGDVEPLGPQIGVAQVVPASCTNTRGTYWSAGQIPTVPGETYTVRIVTADPENFEAVAPFCETIKRWGGNPIPDGKTWADGKIVSPTPEMQVASDDDGIISTLSAANEYKHAVGGKVFGQTFKARGSSVVGAIFLTGDEKLYALSIHDGPGSDGFGGRQIGPTKYTVGVAWDGRTVTTWSPGEVPVVKGRTYYLKIRKVDGSDIVVYTTKGTPSGDDQYPEGVFYKDGEAFPEYDISGSIFEEESIGSATKPFVQIDDADIKVTCSVGSATIEWETDRRVTGILEWGKGTPYTETARTDTVSRRHKITLEGLEPHTMYHYRVGGESNTVRRNRSHDYVFVTLPPKDGNLLSNHTFEGSLKGWTPYGEGVGFRTSDWPRDSGPRSGISAFAGTGEGTAPNGGVYQTVKVRPGSKLTASMWLYTFQSGGNWKYYEDIVNGRIGIDPTGGTDPTADTIIWSDRTMAHKRYVNIAVEAEAVSEKATVFCEGSLLNPAGSVAFVIDDAVLTQTGAGGR